MKQSKLSWKSIVDRVENLPKWTEWVVWAVYILGVIAITAFHEPWFDEAEAWVIARDASFKDMLFLIPHYEGHPPFWDLYLAIFARGGLPYDFGLKAATILIDAVAVLILLKKAPFCKLVRYMIPFNYFLFYHYGVMSRCYCFMFLGFVLMAVYFKEREKRPIPFILAMCMVCMSSAYGLLFCFGITLAWLIEIIRKNHSLGLVNGVIKNKQFLSMFILLAVAIMIVLMIVPYPDTFAHAIASTDLLAQRLYYTFIILPIDALFFSAIHVDSMINIDARMVILTLIAYLLMATVIGFICKKTKKTLYIVIPYLAFCLFGGIKYIATHHEGVLSFLYLFWIWICVDETKDFFEIPEAIVKHTKEKERKQIYAIATVFAAMCLVIPIYWSVCASYYDVNYTYEASRETAKFLKETGLDQRRIMMNWLSVENKEGETIQLINNQLAPAVNAYFDHNIFYTYNYGDPKKTYADWKMLTQDQVDEMVKVYGTYEKPEVLINDASYAMFFPDYVADYVLVKTIREGQIYKDFCLEMDKDGFRNRRILLREDLLEEYGLTPIKDYYED